MPTLRSKLQTLAFDLNDKDSVGTPLPILLEYLNAGLCLAASLNPKRFASPVDVPLVPGAQQPTGCSFLTGIVGVLTPLGVVPVSKRAVDSAAAAAFGRVQIAADKYFPTSVQPSDDDRESFYVDPPAPVGVKTIVRIMCASPVTFIEADADNEMTVRQCAQYEIAREWAMFRALSGERESARGAESSTVHRQTFFTLVGAVLNSEATMGDAMQGAPKK